MTVGDFIRRKRGSRTITSVAKAIGVSVGYLSDVERGHRGLTPERAKQLVKELHITCNEEGHFLGLAALSQTRVSFVLDELTEAAKAALVALSGAAGRLSSREWDAIEKIARGS